MSRDAPDAGKHASSGQLMGMASQKVCGDAIVYYYTYIIIISIIIFIKTVNKFVATYDVARHVT